MKKLLSVLLGVGTLAGTPAFSDTVSFEFIVDIVSGELVGDTFTGRFSYDGDAVTGVEDEFVALSSLRFDFQGQAYGLDDGTAEAAFFDGDFLGLSYSVDFPARDAFSFLPGFFDLDEAFFAYEAPGGDGIGAIAYTVVPLPGALLLFASGVLGVFGIRRHG
jgi:hypothetical protein